MVAPLVFARTQDRVLERCGAQGMIGVRVRVVMVVVIMAVIMVVIMRMAVTVTMTMAVTIVFQRFFHLAGPGAFSVAKGAA